MEYQWNKVDGYEVCYSADWICDLESERHFSWYYHQAHLVYSNCTREHKILEIGLGTGLLSDLLKRRGWDARTLDIDANKRPDFCESAVAFDYRKHAFEVVLAFEVFEHIPFPTFEKVIAKLADANVEGVYFSLPWNEVPLIDVSLKLPKLPVVRWSWSIPGRKIATRAHFWELGRRARILGEKRLVTLQDVETSFKNAGYDVFRLKKVGYIEYFAAKPA